LKVLHITHLYPRPYDHFYSIAVHKQIKALRRQGCLQKVISPIPWSPFPINHISDKWKNYSQAPTYNTHEGIAVFYPRYLVFPKALLLNTAGVRMYWGIKRLIRKIEIEFQFDLIHAHMALPDGYAGMLISKEYGKPLVVTFQATDLDITANRNKSCLLALQKVFTFAKRVISPSPRLAKDFVVRFGIEPLTIGYGFSAGEVFTGDDNVLKAYEGRSVLLSVSRLIPTKGIELNICAVKQLIEKHEGLLYLIIGDGPDRAKLEKLTSDLGLSNHVVFIGHVPHETVMKYMANCDVFALPSWQETFGLVYVEAMAHGKPVVAVQNQGVDGIVIHGKNGLLVKPRDIDSLVKALDFLLSQPEEARTMGERARKLVLEHYTSEKNAEKTLQVYHEVLNEKQVMN
jgi:teichuronic acid biosynthesis glycosyltransferase TuaC